MTKKQKSVLGDDIPVAEVMDGVKGVFKGVVGLIPTHKKKLDAKSNEVERLRKKIERIKKSRVLDDEIRKLREEEERLREVD